MDIIRARELVRGYLEYWGDPLDQFDVEHIEYKFSLPILDPETGEDSEDLPAYKGFFDKVVVDKSDGKRYVMDHKTSNEAIEDPTSGFWQRWAVTLQGSLYLLAMDQAGIDCDGMLIDAVKKLNIKPTAKDGTMEGYGLRARESIATNPERFYARQTVKRSLEQKIECLQDMSYNAHDVADIRGADQTNYPKNTSSCFAYGTACKYLGICSHFSSFLEEGWVRKEPFEFSWSSSSLSTFMSCPRKFYYEYKHFGHGISKEHNSHATAFGTLLHSFLDAIYGDD